MLVGKINISIMKRFIILLIITAVLSSCGTSKYIEQSIKSLQSRIIQLENKNSILSSQIENIKRDNKELKKLIIERDKIDNVTSTQNIDTDETVRSTTTPINYVHSISYHHDCFCSFANHPVFQSVGYDQ